MVQFDLQQSMSCIWQHCALRGSVRLQSDGLVKKPKMQQRLWWRTTPVQDDIGCRFSSTVTSSSLCEKAEQLNFRCYVNTFHGYSYNFARQMKNHPNIIDGTGKIKHFP
jgi:hypothetical protein